MTDAERAVIEAARKMVSAMYSVQPEPWWSKPMVTGYNVALSALVASGALGELESALKDLDARLGPTVPEGVERDGGCRCGHLKSDHIDGRGTCQERDRGLACGCRRYVAKQPLTPAPAPEPPGGVGAEAWAALERIAALSRIPKRTGSWSTAYNVALAMSASIAREALKSRPGAAAGALSNTPPTADGT